jgi:hypothetical protein
MKPEQAQHLFFSGGTQYYIAGRYAALAGLAPVAGNLMHHAIEHFMKGGLVETKSLKELAKRALGHNLPEIWKAFKAQANGRNLSRFDDIISKLHDFEYIRYPDAMARGALCTFNITKAAAAAVARSTYSLGEVFRSAKGRLLINTIESNRNDPNGWGPGRGWEILPDHVARYFRTFPTYELILEEIDELVAAIFAATSLNPQFYFTAYAYRPDAVKYLIKHNNVRAIAEAVPRIDSAA